MGNLDFITRSFTEGYRLAIASKQYCFVNVHTFFRLSSFAPSGLKIFVCFVTQGVALG